MIRARERGKIIRELKGDNPQYVINYLNKKNIDIYDYDLQNKCPLVYAIEHRAYQTLERFLQEGWVKVDAVNLFFHSNSTQACTSLSYILQNSRVHKTNPSALIELFVRGGATMSLSEPSVGSSFLINALDSNHPYYLDIIQTLLKCNLLSEKTFDSAIYDLSVTKIIKSREPFILSLFLDAIQTVAQLDKLINSLERCTKRDHFIALYLKKYEPLFYSKREQLQLELAIEPPTKIKSGFKV